MPDSNYTNEVMFPNGNEPNLQEGDAGISDSMQAKTEGNQDLQDVEDESSELTGCGTCCDPRNQRYRFNGLFFLCFIGFGSYFCYDTPASLQNQIIEDMGVNTQKYSSLYSLYSWPNVILCFVGGFLIDRVFGIRLGAIIFSSLVTIGQFIYAFGAFSNQFWMMQSGRFVFGVGAESLAVAQNAYTVSWFKGKELNLVFGLLLSMSRLGSTVNFLVMGPLYAWVDTFEDGYRALGTSLLIAGATCTFSLISVLILGLLDKRRSTVLKLDMAETGEKVQIKDILTFPLTFWLITIICVTYYVAIFPFIGLAKVFFMRKFNFDDYLANAVSSVVYIMSTVFSPILGHVVDRTGRNIMWVFIAVLLTLGCHALLTFTFINPFVAMCIMGVGYSLLASSLWPMVSLIIPDKQLGSAYGMMQSIQNLGLALISRLGGYIVDTKGYFILEMFYMIWLCVALASTAVIWLVDGNEKGFLMMSPKQRRNLKASEVKSDNEMEKESFSKL